MKKILVFDDDNGILEVIKIILEEKGYQVKTLSSFDNAFTEIGDYQPDLILIDLFMPKVSGEQIVKMIKNNTYTKAIPIIILSASKDTKEIARKSGADDFLYKPFDANELEDLVDKYTLTNN